MSGTKIFLRGEKKGFFNKVLKLIDLLFLLKVGMLCAYYIISQKADTGSKCL